MTNSKYRSVVAKILPLLMLVQLAACSTVDRDIQTPTGPQAIIEGPLDILRVVRKTTTSGNRENAGTIFTENVLVSCPSFTQIVIPSIQNLTYGFGEIMPEDLSSQDPVTGAINVTIDADQRPLGVTQSEITVVDIDSPDSSGEQRVTLRVRAILSDDNADDRY